MEKVAEKIAEEGSKTVFGFLRDLIRLKYARRFESEEAVASSIKQLAQVDVDIEGAKRRAVARREDELAELEHRAQMERRKARFMVEELQLQINYEEVVSLAIEKIAGVNRDVSEAKNVEGLLDDLNLSNDWVLKFSTYAESVSETYAQELAAEVLARAIRSDGRSVSFKTIDTLRFLDKKTIQLFMTFVPSLIAHRSITYDFFSKITARQDSQFAFDGLFERDLVRLYDRRHVTFQFGSYAVAFAFRSTFVPPISVVEFTETGFAIASLLFPDSESFVETNRPRNDMYGFVWGTSDLAIDLEIVGILARSIVSCISDLWGYTLTIMHNVKNERVIVFQKHRSNIASRMNFPEPAKLFEKTGEYSESLKIFLEELRNFEEHALEHLVSDAQEGYSHSIDVTQ